MVERDAALAGLLEFARASNEVVAVYVFGSRGRPDGLADDVSDYDVCVVLRDDADVAAFDQRWPYVHGASVEVARATLSELRKLGEYGTTSAWTRPLYQVINLLVDKTGEVAGILDSKRSVPAHARDGILRNSLDAYINATYRSLRYRLVGAGAGVRFDAADAVSPLLDFLFALDGRVRPWNKYLESETRERPLPGAITIDRLLTVLAGDQEEQHAVFRDVELLSRQHGLGDSIDAWEPDVAWLRGDGPYRAT
ncbi:MAG TPA: nucleotidyltransferase domain-containing protein [Gaiellaceae bacterium]|nr:nucleotidyltransferase domain-containing protein [Gaiellaceae bacterium]